MLIWVSLLSGMLMIWNFDIFVGPQTNSWQNITLAAGIRCITVHMSSLQCWNLLFESLQNQLSSSLQVYYFVTYFKSKRCHILGDFTRNSLKSLTCVGYKCNCCKTYWNWIHLNFRICQSSLFSNHCIITFLTNMAMAFNHVIDILIAYIEITVSFRSMYCNNFPTKCSL